MRFFSSPAPSLPARPRQPVLNLPPGVKRIALFLLVVHVARQFLSPRGDAVLIYRLAFIPQRYTPVLEHLRPLRLADWPLLTSPFTYMAVHGGWLHLGINLLSLAAFGSPVEKLLGPRRMLLIFLLSGFGGALLQACLAGGPEPILLIGASGGISGLFAAAFIAYAPAQKTRQRLAAIAILSLGLIASGMAGMPGNRGMPISWAAHLGGFLSGLLLVRLMRRLPRPAS
jgi:membrane associated rhomboid family serine protease